MTSEKSSLVANQEQPCAGEPAYGTVHSGSQRTTPTNSGPRRFFFTGRDAVIIGVLVLLAAAVIAVGLVFGIPALNEKRARYYNLTIPPSPSELFTFNEYAVATDADYCAPIGADILKQGGSAVDAAIATLLCNGVVHPDAMGLGGGVLLNIFDKQAGTVTVIDGRETAPAAAETIPEDKFEEGPLSVAVPGELLAYEKAHELFGKLEWAKLVTPTIDLCTEGFNVTKYFATKLKKYQSKIIQNAHFKARFFNAEQNRVYEEGETIYCGKLTTTLKVIRDTKSADFYGGSLGEKLVKDLQAAGGNLSIDDLREYRVRQRSAIQVKLPSNGVTIYSPPAPASGPVLSMILNIMDGFGFSAQDAQDVNSATLMYHRLIEAFKFGFAAKTHLADEDFLNNTEIVERFISAAFAEEVRGKMDNVTHPADFYSPLSPLPEDKGTGQVSVLTAKGMAVSATSSINSNFGGFVMSPETGIILNNHMADFTPGKGHPNSVAHGKRPMSSMVPCIFVDEITGDPILVLGGVGHTRITSGVAQVAFRHLYLKQTIKEAIDAPRLHNQLYPDSVYYQYEFPGVLIDKLALRGHRMKLENEPNSFTAISRNDHGLQANVDYRRGSSSVAGL